MNNSKETTLEEVYGMPYEEYKKIEDKYFENLNKKFKEFGVIDVIALVKSIQRKKQYLIKKYNDKEITKMIEYDTAVIADHMMSGELDDFQTFRRYFEYTEHIQDSLKDFYEVIS